MLRKKYMMLGLMFVSVAVYGQKTELGNALLMQQKAKEAMEQF